MCIIEAPLLSDHNSIIGKDCPTNIILVYWSHCNSLYKANRQLDVNSSRPSDAFKAITWTNAGLLSIGLMGRNFSEIRIGMLSFSFQKMHLKLSSTNMAAILSRGDELRLTPHWFTNNPDIQPPYLCCTTCPGETLPSAIIVMGVRYFCRFSNCIVMHNGYKLTTLVYTDCMIHLSVTNTIDYNLEVNQAEFSAWCYGFFTIKVHVDG